MLGYVYAQNCSLLLNANPVLNAWWCLNVCMPAVRLLLVRCAITAMLPSCLAVAATLCLSGPRMSGSAFSINTHGCVVVVIIPFSLSSTASPFAACASRFQACVHQSSCTWHQQCCLNIQQRKVKSSIQIGRQWQSLQNMPKSRLGTIAQLAELS